MRRSLSVLIMVFLLAAAFVSPVAASREKGVIHYIALGDSLAAGMTPDKQIGEGYADFIAAIFKDEGVLGSFTKQFSFPGFTSQQVLESVKTDEAAAVLKEANLVTISAGANDLLRLVKFDKETNDFSYDPSAVKLALIGIYQNVSETVKHIKSLNGDAKVFVMGYYFPFPHLEGEQKGELVKISSLLDSTIESAALAEGGVFVPVSDKFGTDGIEYVPNPNDVHPSIEGYKLLADAFFETYLESQPQAAYKDVTEDYWAYKEIMMLANAGVLAGRTEDHFLPEKPVTKAEAAVALARLIPVTGSVPPNPGFKDVLENHPAYYEIAKMTEIGLFVKAENFNPNSPLTRAQMSKIITLAFHLKPIGSMDFKDVSDKLWAIEYIDTLSSNGIVQGNVNGEFQPNAPTKRSHFAVILVRTLTSLNQLHEN
ncbi:S-layer homology domain-containing protein [Cytobacillus oceanisediminis]|uniref:S-layer homology domain-containing protein n=1 Tax=Cytobacillus oceanisediminis TaxID=665099 RepID=UPI003736E773